MSLGEHDPRYRKNVGVVVFNAQGQVWLGRRDGVPAPFNWQFPQGGVDEGEDLEPAARRELQEETGITSVRFLGRTDAWITYDFPADIVHRGRGFLGQAQAWFAFAFEGTDGEIDLGVHTHPEFDSWRWANLDEALESVVPFKRAAYEKVAAAFRPFAAPRPPLSL
jgi:putative (di)nucleoside polyphosphate hydrolase